MRRKLRWLLVIVVLCGGPSSVRAEESPAERRARVKNLSPEAKEELRLKEERFANLSESERQRLRSLHEELSKCDDSARLQGVLERYHAWLATLSSTERAKLLDLPADERIKRIKKTMEEQEEQRFRDLARVEKLSPADQEAIGKWLESFIDAHQAEILAATQEQWRPSEGSAGYRMALTFQLLWHWTSEDSKMPKPSAEEVNDLVASLSPEARKPFEAKHEPGVKTKLVQEWVRAAIVSRRMPLPVSTETLLKFYKEELSDQERERLDNLPNERWQDELRRAYTRRYGQRGWPGRGGRGGRGGPPREEGGGRGGRGRGDETRGDENPSDEKRGDGEKRSDENRSERRPDGQD
jgi:hypothetical protein